MKHILDRFDTCWMWYHFCPLSHWNDYYGTIEPLWNVSSLWSNCYLAFLGCPFLQYNVFYSLSSCMNYAVYVKRLKICFHCILSEWDLLYQGFKKKKKKKAKLECCCWPWHQTTRQTLYSYVWILTKCDVKANRVLAWDPPGQQSDGAFLYSKFHFSLLLV